MQVNFTARNLSVSDSFREYVDERTHKVEQLTHNAQTLEIKVTRHDHSKNSGAEDQVELTVFVPGHIVRAEAQAADKFAAFDIAFGKLSERLRRAADRRKHHHGKLGTRELTAHNFSELDIQPVEADLLSKVKGSVNPTKSIETVEQPNPLVGSSDLGHNPIVLRRKQFAAAAMTADDALHHMELVGHDFYLFLDSDTGKSSVVYRRKGWNYGVISLT